MGSSKMLESLWKDCFVLGVVFGFIALLAGELEDFQMYALPIGLVGVFMFVLWLVLFTASVWRERSKDESMKHVLQEVEDRGEAPLTEIMESIFVKWKIPYDTQKEYFAVFERCDLVEIVDGYVKLKKKEQ